MFDGTGGSQRCGVASPSANASAATERILWPSYESPSDLDDIEAVPLGKRNLPVSTYSLLVRAVRLWPHKRAISVLPDAERWNEPLGHSYSQVLNEVHRVANLLHSLGTRRSDAVALIAPNCAELITATLGAQLAGIAVPINGTLCRNHIEELLRQSGARVLIAAGPALSPSTWRTAIDLASDGRVDAVLALRHTPHDDVAALPLIQGVVIGYLHELGSTHDVTHFVGVPPLDSDLAALIHTGGTTGVPKLAAHRHSSQVANSWMIAAAPLLDEQTSVFSALPLFHANALIVSVLAPLFKGLSVVWAGPLGYRDPSLYAAFWTIVAHYRIAVMSAVPTVYAALAEYPVDDDIGCLRYGIVGASPLPRAVRERFERATGVALVEGYGLTEATCASALNFPHSPRSGSVGQRLPYQKARVVRIADDGRWEQLQGGATGVLALSGPTVFAGYVVGRDDQGYHLDGMNTLVDGWLNTGDLARMDPDGFIYLQGRAKDLIIRGGHNIDPVVIEEALLGCPGVTAAAAVGRPDAHAGEVPVAYVTLAADSSATESAILAWVSERVPEQGAAPKSVTVLDALPVTNVGKPYKPALRADATRRALVEALAGMPGVCGIDTKIDGGVITSTVVLEAIADEKALADALDRYAVVWNAVHVPSRGQQPE